MATLLVPPLDRRPWPSLGDACAEWLTEHAVYGPGELAGKPYQVLPEFRAQLLRMYEIHPKGSRGEGRRRFAQCFLEQRKGTAKTERAALVALLETHPDAPARFAGWESRRRDARPLARGVVSPYVPLMAYTVDQTEDLAFHVLKRIIEEAPALHADNGGPYDTGLDRIIVLDANGRAAGKIAALAGSPNARDGARTTFQHFDEPHRYNLPRLRRAHSTMVENTYKRAGAQAWSLYTSTAGELGEESVAEELRAIAQAIKAGSVEDPRLFYFSRHAPLELPLDTPDQVRTALLEASGADASWSADLDGLVARYFTPRTDRPYFRRVWLNQWVPGSGLMFDLDAWRARARPAQRLPAGAFVTLGFDGSRTGDATALVATDVGTGLVVPVAVWERPFTSSGRPAAEWEVPRAEVDEVVAATFDRFNVWRLYADPFRWGPWLAEWAGKYTEDRVISWDTTKARRMAYAIKGLLEAIDDGTLTHTGDPTLERHIGNTYRKRTPFTEVVDGEERPLYVMAKETPASRRVIDAAMAACLSWQARTDAVAAGAKPPRRYRASAL